MLRYYMHGPGSDESWYSRIERWIGGTGKRFTLRFEDLVPRLPSALRSENILSYYRWATDSDDSERQGGGLQFARAHAAQIAKITGISLLWIFSTFISPLSMNLVCLNLAAHLIDELNCLHGKLLNYVQDQRAGLTVPLSPYVFALGLFVGPVLTSIVSALSFCMRSLHLVGSAISTCNIRNSKDRLSLTMCPRPRYLCQSPTHEAEWRQRRRLRIGR